MSFSRSALHLEKGTPAQESGSRYRPREGSAESSWGPLEPPRPGSAVENPGGRGGPEFPAHSALPPLPHGGRRGRVVESALALCSFLCPQFPC